MNWYKKEAQLNLENFEDRNILNGNIRFLLSAGESLDEMSKVVFQDAGFAKDKIFALANEKKMGNHPKIRSILLDADQLALDSPWKFADMCIEAADRIDRQIIQMKRDREDFANKTSPNKMKGWHVKYE